MRSPYQAKTRAALLLTSLGVGLSCGQAFGCSAGGARAAHPAIQLELVQEGPGRYSLQPPEGEAGPEDSAGSAVEPRVTDSFSQHPQTNDWWSSLMWSWDPDERFSTPLYPHPLSVRAKSEGLELGYPDRPTVTQDDYSFPHEADLIVGPIGMKARESRVESYSDWTVTNSWTDGQRGMLATFGHGMPFVYMTKVRGGARVVPSRQEAKLTFLEGAEACFEVKSHHYCAYAAPQHEWVEAKGGVTSEGSEFFSVALLPDGAPETRALFRQHAYAFVTGSRVEYEFLEKEGTLRATYLLESESRDVTLDADVSRPDAAAAESGDSPSPLKTSGAPPTKSEPLLSLYRHQAERTKDELLDITYVSPRGPMRLRAGRSFTTRTPVGSLLPALPAVEIERPGRLRGFVKLVSGSDLFPMGGEGTRDSYWEGKSFGRAAQVALIADQMGMTKQRDKIVARIEEELEDWFDGEEPRQYFYDEKWHTLIGTPSMYHSGRMMNDHHFHYAYYVHAAAVVAMFDRGWAEKWAPMVELLIRDAGSWDRKDEKFPYLRYFDPYAGHSWASGTVMGPRGNNQESSAEDLNFAAAVALWGSVMRKQQIRDLGLYMHSTLKEAVAHYWYDIDDAVYPSGFDRPGIGIVWGNGAAYTTWFSYQPVFIHGIQLTPMHTGMLWLGAHPEKVGSVIESARRGNRGEIHMWRDLFLQLGAFSDPTATLQRFDEEHFFEAEFGTSHAHTYHFLSTMKALGPLNPNVTANTAHYAVFERGKKRTHVAYNFESKKKRVEFSDGTSLEVEPHSLGVSR